MKYTVEIEINKPIEKVIELFDNPNNWEKWMEGLINFEILNGKFGQPDTKTKLNFKMGKREIEMIETIIVRNLPDELSATYKAKGVFNIVKNRFISITNDRTNYLTEQEFQFSGFMRIIGFIMPKAFKKQSLKQLTNFKNFVENQG